MNVVGHHAGGIQLVFSARVMQNRFKCNVTLSRRKLPMHPCAKSDHVFRPRTLKMRETTLARDLTLEQLDAFIERLIKGFFFATNGFFDCRLFRADFAKNIAHRFCDNIDKFEEEWFVKTERAAIPNSTTK